MTVPYNYHWLCCHGHTALSLRFALLLHSVKAVKHKGEGCSVKRSKDGIAERCILIICLVRMSRARRSRSGERLLANQTPAVGAHFEVYRPFCCPLAEIKLNLLYARFMSPSSRTFSLTALEFFPLCLKLRGFGRETALIEVYPGKKQNCVKPVWFCHTASSHSRASSPGNHNLFEKSASWYFGMLSIKTR